MSLIREGVSPLLARVLAGRGIQSQGEIAGGLKHLIHHTQLKGSAEAAVFLADALAAHKRFLVVADYDCDGATACSVALRGLRALGAQVEYIVPDRMIHGYGLTPSVVELAYERFPDTDVLITVDNGVASHAGVEAARALGLDILVTDHHLPAKNKPLPAAHVIVDPSQPGCLFPSKALAGVGVIWYVLWALQDELRQRGLGSASFKVSSLLPLVAVGTVADVVPLDRNNRILVQAGLERIRAGDCPPGITALATAGVINRTDPKELLTSHIAFGIGPRINAAGRLETMDIGIACLTTDDPARADELANQLDAINQERKEVENATVIEAVEQADALVIEGTRSIAAHSDDWHAGVIGIVAGRIKERRYRPTFVLTTDPATGQIKGSGRSIPGFNLKDALDQVDKACPGLMPKFGGHAMAAGVTLKPGGFDVFRDAFEVEAAATLTDDVLHQHLDVDGSLTGQELSVAVAKSLSGPPWGQMFPEPAFCDEFDVLEAKLTGPYKDQLNMVLFRDGVTLKATRFRHDGELPGTTVKLVYKLNLTRNKFGKDELKLLVDSVS
ncbi:single-stranded-DNA-specific exonuclease RecJ [Paraburkholderia aspalathi]|nr:single-stranded-DNA-specific exonuclease RecJ [Paraburkholderia aspalathi]MBK3779972.1 single-stranded-DNA-specific exonuclease RecJ [Paraburkholderia aspalathi]